MSKNKDNRQLEAELDPVETIEGESKDAKFRRLARYRYEKAVGRIRQIGNLSNKNLYDYTEEQARGMFDLLRMEINECERKFMNDEKEIVDPFAGWGK